MMTDIFHYVFAVAVLAAICVLEVSGHEQMEIINTLLALLAVQVGYRIKGNDK